MKPRFPGSLATLLLAAPAAFAHPGHDPLDHGLRHWATSPDHVAWAALSGVALLMLGRLAGQPRWRRTCAVAGAGLLAGALALANGRA